MSKVYFVTFADSMLKPALKRIGKQAKELGVFDELYLYTQKDLPQYLKDRIKYVINTTKSKRGYGYWCWKPALIKEIMDKANTGDYIVYSDAGSHINPQGKERFFEYLKKVDNNDILAIKSNDDFNDLAWTKMDTINLFKGKISKEQLSMGQFGGGFLLLKKNKYTIEIISRWCELMSEDNLHYFDDSPSALPNDDNFCENRHDQSILSLLLKSNHCALVSIDEFYSVKKEGWEKLIANGSVILFKRDKKRTLYGYFLSKFKKLGILKK